ncbi:MAG: DUF5011 domain-containing protein [Candidatus Hydrogenedens sp.]|nr:DUF5011 domain-containing protein [Candidatus Hydrogenedens sp.]
MSGSCSTLGRAWSILLGALVCAGATLASAQTVTVNTLADENNGDTASITALLKTPGGTGISLREAILATNNTVSASKTIAFSVTGEIKLSSALPVVSGGNLVIDGNDEILLTPNRISSAGLTISSSKVSVLQLNIQGFTEPGIYVEGAPEAADLVIQGCKILDNGGTSATASGAGIRLVNVNGATIGGTQNNQRNLISGNSSYGIVLDSGTLKNVTITGNYIGTTEDGREPNGNGKGGILIGSAAGASDTTVTGNLISGNSGSGVRVSAGSSGSAITNNIIGLDEQTKKPIPNSGNGIHVTGGTATLIGNTTAGSANVIAANGANGVLLDSTGGSTTGTLVRGNYIGSNGGSTLIGNGENGVEVRSGVTLTSIGGTAAGAANVIAGNTLDGVLVTTAIRVNIRQNSIYSNGKHGIELLSGANNNMARPGINRFDSAAGTLHGTAPSTGGGDNIDVFEDSADQGRTFLGSTTSATGGLWSLGGITLDPAKFYTATATNATGNTSEFSIPFVQKLVVDTTEALIDGATSSPWALMDNKGIDGKISLYEAVAAANNQGGVLIEFAAPEFLIAPEGDPFAPLVLSSGYNILRGGGTTTFDGKSAGFLDSGIKITGRGNRIEGMILRGWTGAGIFVSGANADDTVIVGCDISDCASQQGAGIDIGFGADDTQIGDGTPVGANYLYANHANGIVTLGNRTEMRGNLVGWSPTGEKGGNSDSGIVIDIDASDCTIGGPDPGDANVIASNSLYGIDVRSGADNTTIEGNLIGTAPDNAKDFGNGRSGIRATTVADLLVTGNTIVDNTQYGVTIEGASTGARITKNFIGTDSLETQAGNGFAGIRLTGTTTDTIIGTGRVGADFSQGNTIAFNGTNGIQLSGSVSGNTWRGNSIFSNAASGVTKDSGALNGGIIPPLVVSVDPDTNVISGTGEANSTLDVYYDNGGQAREYLRSANINGAGNWTLTNVDFAQLATRRFGLIQTDPDDNSSNIATFTMFLNVTTFNDTTGGVATGLGDLLNSPGPDGLVSLREAINAANGQPGPKTISFSAPGGTVNLSSALPNLTSSDLTLDGGGTRLDGAAIPSGTPAGIGIYSSRNIIQNLTITRFGGPGILVDSFGGADSNLIRACLIGTDGTQPLGNTGAGIELEDVVTNTIIGGTEPADRNIISGNGGSGIEIGGNANNGNAILGNYIGLNAAGTGAMANAGNGVLFSGTSTNTFVGSSDTAGRNIISGNGGNGIRIISATADSVSIFGNYIGTTANGLSAIANGDAGVVSVGGTNVLLGGPGENEGNLISGNASYGVIFAANGGSPCRIEGNNIGAGRNGFGALPNEDDGILLGDTTSGLTIHGNLISGNEGNGITLDGAGSGNVITANFIGTSIDGMAAVPNTGNGVQLKTGANTNIGEPSAGNVISGNIGNGILLSPMVGGTPVGTALNTLIRGNFIGTSVDGQSAIGNGQAGVALADGTTGVTIGGNTAAAANVISGNLDAGIYAYDLGTGDAVDTHTNTISGNIIGAKAADYSGIRLFETDALGNQANGITLLRTYNNTVGGTTAAHGNIVAFNGNSGVEVSASASTGNQIRRNRITGNGFGVSGRGIKLTLNANDNRTAPTLLSSSPPGGQSFPGAKIDLYADTTDQGMLYIGSTTASGDGTWISGALDLNPYQGLNLTATATDAANNTSPFGNTIAVPDTTPPVITLLGDATLVLECGNLSPDVMIQAIDNADGDITENVVVTVQDSNLSAAVQQPGMYLFRYNVSDEAGNNAIEVTRTVEVTDTTPPVLTLLGALELEVGCFESYVDPGATATDNCDTNVDISVEVDTTVAGEQTVFVKATDNFGNEDIKTRTLIVGGAASSEIFVANDGVDQAAGGTELSPFKTIAYAMAQADCLAAPDNIVTIRLAPGLYPEVVAFSPYTRLIGAGSESSIIRPSAAAIDAVVGDVAVTGAQGSTLEELALEIPTNAPSATRILFIDDVSMLVRRVRITGTSQQTDSVGISVTEPGSSGTRVVRSIIENVNSGVLAVQTNARFGLNVLRDIKEIGVLVEPPNNKGTEGEGEGAADGTTPVFGDENELQSTGSNTFEDFGSNATFIVNNSDEEMLAQFNDWDGLTDSGEIGGMIQGDVVFTPFLQSNAVFLSTVVIEVLSQNQPLTGASVSTVPGVNVNATESQAGTYVFTGMPNGRYSFVVEKDGFVDRVLVLEVQDVVVSAVTELAQESGNGGGGIGAHSADINGNNAVDLSELLRVIQLYNVTSFSCLDGTEDGYTLGPGDRNCDRHSADYEEPFWVIKLSEVLRLVQLFNSGGFTACGNNEDGFCPNG